MLRVAQALFLAAGGGATGLLLAAVLERDWTRALLYCAVAALSLAWFAVTPDEDEDENEEGGD